ncbi:hypothetical protein AAA536_07915 [Pseudomonas aeruginosa]
MENILHKHKQDTAYRESFLILEQELATALGLINEDIWVIKESLLNRLAAINPSLKSNKHLFTYRESLFEIISPEHALTSIIPQYCAEEIEHELNYREEEFNEYLFGISKRTIDHRIKVKENPNTPISLMDDEYITYFSSFNHHLHRMGIFNYPLTKGHIENNHIYKRFEQLLTEYFYLVASSNEPTNELAEQHVSKKYRYQLSKAFRASMNLLSSSRRSRTKEQLGSQFNLANLYTVYSNIANMNNIELTQFMTGYYSDIPYFGEKAQPTVSVAVYEPENTRKNILEGDITQLFIKSKNELIHIEYEDSYEIHKFDKYSLNGNETLIIAGEEVAINETCLEDNHFTVFEMLHYDSFNIRVSKDFTYDEATFRKIAMTYGKDNEFYEHLLDRKGLYQRWH